MALSVARGAGQGPHVDTACRGTARRTEDIGRLRADLTRPGAHVGRLPRRAQRRVSTRPLFSGRPGPHLETTASIAVLRRERWPSGSPRSPAGKFFEALLDGKLVLPLRGVARARLSCENPIRPQIRGPPSSRGVVKVLANAELFEASGTMRPRSFRRQTTPWRSGIRSGYEQAASERFLVCLSLSLAGLPVALWTVVIRPSNPLALKRRTASHDPPGARQYRSARHPCDGHLIVSISASA